MFNFLKGTKTELTVTLDRPNGLYYPGDTVGATIEIQPNKELKLHGARVKLSGTEKYEYTYISHSTDSDGNSSDDYVKTWGTNEFFASEENFLGATTLPGGVPQRYSFRMGLPSDALPSLAGKIVRIQWKAGVKLDRRLAGDLHSEAELRVGFPDPGPAIQPGEYGESNEPGETELTFLLPGLETVAGQSLNGQLRVLPRKNFDASEVRLELVCHEYVSYDQGNESEKVIPFKLAGGVQFTAGQTQTIPFQASIPQEAAPSIQTPNGSIVWTMKGILSRRLRKDTTIEQGFVVYPARV